MAVALSAKRRRAGNGRCALGDPVPALGGVGERLLSACRPFGPGAKVNLAIGRGATCGKYGSVAYGRGQRGPAPSSDAVSPAPPPGCGAVCPPPASGDLRPAPH